MATGTGESGRCDCRARSVRWIDPDGAPLVNGTTGKKRHEGDRRERLVDFEFEWHRLCHGCGEQKRFRALICDECRQRHGV
ncbi:hypothetical protein [Natronococcus wangiae]|uniref:hypothetical protein n=1 Tax=Natronococcus wangiae TaxID=3068275 RepID=UPI00273E9A27|nr:hypothetical protein [Natronococcus sp. AD5]